MSELDETSKQDLRRKSGEFMRMADELFQSADYDGALRLVLLALDIEPSNPFVIAYRQRIQDAMNAGQETDVPLRGARAETIVGPSPGSSPTGAGVSEEKRVSRVHEEVARLEAEKKKREETEAEQRFLMEEERRKAEEEVRRTLDEAHRQLEEERKRFEEERRLRQEAEKRRTEEVEARKQLDGELRRIEEEMEYRLQVEREKSAQVARESQEGIEASRKVNEREIRKIEEDYKKKIEEEKRKLTEEKERVNEEMRARLEEERKNLKKMLKKQQEKEERRHESATSRQLEPEGGRGEEVMKALSGEQFRSLVDSIPSFAFGMASIIDILAAPSGARVVIKYLDKKYGGALESNWMAVSEDLRDALVQLEKEAHGQS